MKKFLKILLVYAGIPFAASVPGLILDFCGLTIVNILLVPGLTALGYILFRKKMDLKFAAKTNGLIALILVGCFTIFMIIASGSLEGSLMANFSWLILPFAPIMLVPMLVGQSWFVYLIAFLTYLTAFVVTSLLGKVKIKKIWVPICLAAACLIACTFLYINRPAAKYAGHGFDYMHGYSSTDFTDYTVYSENSKLITLDSPASLVIEKEEDMPVLDGAEACYPLYAAFAKAVYKDIDKIEEQWLKETNNPNCNGKIVSFTNTSRGFSRLLWGGMDSELSDDGIDMFFGAKPSPSQLEDAEEDGIALKITPIGQEAFVFFVEADNPVENLTSEQVKAIYHGDITNWKELGGENQNIRAFQRPKNSGSQTMMEYFMDDVSLKEPETYEMVNAMDGVIRQVAQYANEEGAIGYSFRYFLEELVQEKGVKMLSIDGVYPSLENIENGTYPLTTDVCLITREDEMNPYVQQMIDFILSEEGQRIVTKTGYAGVK
ncbi:MAG: substrate-binding domain-containing protein [Lachnospiraceae bacterium]|nr:substrate-binding domain-containing protein [Lachnospiraceae bacterium]